jgi:hypothetical protein
MVASELHWQSLISGLTVARQIGPSDSGIPTCGDHATSCGDPVQLDT